MEDDIRNQLEKLLQAAKKKISEDFRKKKFQFRKRGRLTKEEEKELREQARTCSTGLRL